MTPSKTDIGFGKKIRGVWLDEALRLVAEGRTFDEAKGALSEAIAVHNPGKEAIQKVLTPVKRVWFKPPERCLGLRDGAVEIHRRNNSAETRRILNWGMAVATYPFVGACAEAFGRLMRLQSDVKNTDLERRVQERFGDREFIRRVVQYNVSSFLDWGVILQGALKGVYVAGKQTILKNPELGGWLVEALLLSANARQISIRKLGNHPMLFPFRIEDTLTRSLAANGRIAVHRESLADEIVVLRQQVDGTR